EPRLSLTFTCTVPDCGIRSTHQFSKRSYQSGIVLVQCPGCKNRLRVLRHLIADHLGWFKDGTQEGKLKTIEDIMMKKGETVKRGTLNANGGIEY
ncbi:DNL zinc finger-domain-containing protein, partial [Vararia minispora EC-137]